MVQITASVTHSPHAIFGKGTSLPGNAVNTFSLRGLYGYRQGPVACSCEHGKELSNSVQGQESLDTLIEYLLSSEKVSPE